MFSSVFQTPQTHSLTDAKSSELAINSPDADYTVDVKQPSLDYTIPSSVSDSVAQDKVNHPNEMTLSSEILPKEKPPASAPVAPMEDIAKHVPKPGETGGVENTLFLEMDEQLAIEETEQPQPQHAACSPKDCSGRGRCHRGRCFCNPGFMGHGCEEHLPCPSSPDDPTLVCSGNGECANGQCDCAPGFEGNACEMELACPQGCTGRGVCRWGQCFCDVGYSGAACELETASLSAECPSACSANGICEAGTCFCKAEFAGADCSRHVDLTEASALSASAHAARARTSQSMGASAFSAVGTVFVAMLAFVVGIAVVAAGRYVRERVRRTRAGGDRGTDGAPIRGGFGAAGLSAGGSFRDQHGLEHVGSLGVLDD